MGVASTEQVTRLFPFPQSGRTRIVQTGARMLSVECSGLNKTDHDLLMGFFCSMQGQFGSFRFERESINHPNCRFDTDSAPFRQDGPQSYSVSLPIRILG